MKNSSDLASLALEIDNFITDSGAQVAVALSTLDNASYLYLNSDIQFHAASTMKVAVMVELFAQAEVGKLSLDDQILIENRFKSLVDGSDFSVELEYDKDHEIAASEAMSLRDLCHYMIVVSSNIATNLIMKYIGVENIQNRLRKLGIHGLHVLRPLEDGRAFEQGLNNTTSAEALCALLTKIGKREMITERACDEMLDIMKRKHWDDPIPSSVPEGVEVANKPGWINGIEHDAGVIFAERPYVLVVMTRGIPEREKSSMLISEISKRVYTALTQDRSRA